MSHNQASAEAAVNLGIDFMPGAKRSTFKRAKLQSRLWNGAKRTQRILKVQAMLTRGKARVSRICMAGLKPQLGFGARVNGLNMDERKAVRAMVAKPMQPTTGGASYLAKLILYNPVADLEVAPVLQLQLEVWRAGTASAGPHWSILQLVQAWRDARPWEVRRWADSRGPLANAALSLKRIGWQVCQTPLELVDDQGATVSLLASSPALFKQVMIAAVKRQMEKGAGC